MDHPSNIGQRFAQSHFTSMQTDSRKDADLQAVYEYVPTLKQSGFIIGNPVAYTNQPFLPPNMVPHSPRRQEFSPNHFSNSQNQFRAPHVSYSPNRQKSKSRVVTHITYNNPAPPQTVYYQTNNSRIFPGPINSPPTSPSRPPSTLITHNLPHSSQKIETVSRQQYERCLQDCRKWQQKYKQAINSNSYQINTYGPNSQGGEEVEELRIQNQKLREKVRKMEAKQQTMVDDLQSVIIGLTNKYRDSTLKECMLLTDRFRLEKKANQRF